MLDPNTEQFVLTFTKSGTAILECMLYDRTINRYGFVPIARESERAERALNSPAGQAYQYIRQTHPDEIRDAVQHDQV